jgi:ribosomal protein S18 acetylase RimI-like enzyme
MTLNAIVFDILALMMMDDFHISRTTMDELAALRTISIATFVQAFAKDNSPENIEAYISTAFDEEQLKAELLEPESEFYLAKKDEQIIGYLKINLSHIESSLEVERIYIDEPYHGKGVAQQLMSAALERARQTNFVRVWLGVWEHNPKAIRFYIKYGFEPYGKHIFLLGDDEQTDILMQKNL